MNYLIVEGIMDVAFVKYICLKNSFISSFDDFQKIKNEYLYNNLTIINLGGQDNLLKKLKFLKLGEDRISRIGIIQDADDDFKESKANIENAIEDSRIDKEKIKIFLTPNNKDLGDLEILLLSTIKDNNIIKCFEPYQECLEKNNHIYEKVLNKGQVYAYTMYSQKGENFHKPQNSFMYKYKENYIDTGLWNLSHPNFKPITNFILQIFK